MRNATLLQNTWNAKSLTVRRTSDIGPNLIKNKLIKVKLLIFMLSLSSILSTKCSIVRTSTINLLKEFISFFAMIVLLASSKSVSALYFGNLCLGQGIKWNNWGTEYKKFMT